MDAEQDMYDVRCTMYDVLVSARCATMRSGSGAEFLEQRAGLAGMRRGCDAETLTFDDLYASALTRGGCGAIAKRNFEAACGLNRDAAVWLRSRDIDDLRLTIYDSLVRRLTPQGCGALAERNFWSNAAV